MLALLASGSAAVPTKPQSTLQADQDPSCATYLAGTNVTSEAEALAYPFARQDHAESDREVVINFGFWHTGSTSFSNAMEKMGLNSCKIQISDMRSITDYIEGSSTSSVDSAMESCDAMGDFPYFGMFPSLMRRYPKGKFVYTKQADCGTWLEHVGALLNCYPTLPLDEFHRCAYSLDAGFYPMQDQMTATKYLEGCVAMERSIVLTARALKVPLLVLPTSFTDEDTMGAIDNFLHTSPRTRNFTEYPYSHTPSCAREGTPTAPAGWVDPNAELFARVTPADAVLR